MQGGFFQRKKSKSKAKEPKAESSESLATFNKYSNKEDGDDPEGQSFRIGPEGIGALCDDLGIDPSEDVRILVLLWKMGANAKPGEISQSEWQSGCQELGIYNIDDFKAHLSRLDPGFLEHSEFRSLYKFVFQFSREGTHKTLEKDMVVALLEMILKPRNNEHLDNFLEFLQSTDDNARVALDQWVSFLDFSVSVGADCAGYDDDEENCAWPVLIDEYVDWVKLKKKP